MTDKDEWAVVNVAPAKSSDEWAVVKKSPSSDSSPESVSMLPEVEPLPKHMEPSKKKEAKTPEQLLEEYNRERTKGQVKYGTIGAGAGATYGLGHKFFPSPELPKGIDISDAERKLSQIQSSRNLEAGDLRRKMQQAGIDLSGLDEARILEEATPQLEKQLGAAEARATSLGSAVKPTINVPPVSSMADIADIIQNSGVSKGEGIPAASGLARETGQHELAHARSQAGKVASKTAEELARARGTSYGELLTGGEAHMPTPSGRVLVPQQVAIQMEQEAIQALNNLTPMRQAAEAEIRRLKSLGQDVSKISGKLADLKKQETLAVQALIAAQQSQSGLMTRLGVAAGKAPMISGALGGLGTALSAYDLSQAEDIPSAALGGVNTALGAMSMVPPIGPLAAGIKGVGTAGSLGMIPVNILVEYARRKGLIGKGSVMDQRKAGLSPELQEKQ